MLLVDTQSVSKLVCLLVRNMEEKEKEYIDASYIISLTGNYI